MRLDKFLKLARLVKRRNAAQEMIELGAVRLDGRSCKSSAEVREGAVLEVAYMNRVLKVRVLCAEEALLRRPGTVSWEAVEERAVMPDQSPWPSE
ncbi:MAG: S4 domain-containing protein [Fretibacterium sp.]|uniref:S4 domain-containing protein n=1 Tax=Fretibacterium sp. OH1220_COT-178 TaxID=2491047 RepID=UPI000F5F76BD|nr:S4 domain-containing protein [Fretibacterium sp. OH1220_COT-178]MDO4785667.1 S4 domain-containing protein [Fretibacterium sp.]RRD65285.1 RNA-binding S4 domain-containing protein [Fretibacterium sp. OH1220_COT-178]